MELERQVGNGTQRKNFNDPASPCGPLTLSQSVNFYLSFTTHLRCPVLQEVLPDRPTPPTLDVWPLYSTLIPTTLLTA